MTLVEITHRRHQGDVIPGVAPVRQLLAQRVRCADYLHVVQFLTNYPKCSGKAVLGRRIAPILHFCHVTLQRSQWRVLPGHEVLDESWRAAPA